MSCVALLLREMTKDVVFRMTGCEFFRPDNFEGKLLTNTKVLREINKGTSLLIINKQVYELNGLAQDILSKLTGSQASTEANSVFEKQYIGRVNP